MSWIQRTLNTLLFSESPTVMDCDLGAWFEVYYVSGYETIPAYLVIVAPERYGMPQVIVRECDHRKRVVYRGDNYRAVKFWLTEDDFLRVTGREFDLSHETDDLWFEVWY